jgi:quinohemoprotein ethanol dehydrogenase
MRRSRFQFRLRGHRRKHQRLALPLVLIVGAAALLLAGCGSSGKEKSIAAFSPVELTAPPQQDWITNGGTVFNQRYSPLDELTPSNVADLKGVWRIHLGSATASKYSGEAQPLVHNGIAYVSTGANDVFALDVKSGKTLWKYNGNLEQEISTVCCGWTSRGVAIGDGRVYLGKLDGKLVALDAKSGKEIWSAAVGDWRNGETITSAALYYDGLVITGVSGGEFGVRGRVVAYDADTGKLVWRFYTIPGPGETGHETWPQDNDAWKHGGAPVWQTPAVDPKLGLLYFSTGNTAPDFDGSSRKGDNLFANSIVAINAKTGEYRWHFQQVHHDIWDLDSPSPVVLFDLELNGVLRHALAEASKTGWVYVLDRTNGKPLIGIEERAVPQEPRQHTAATQPYPVGESFTSQSVAPEEAARLKKARAAAAKEAGGEDKLSRPKWDYVNEGRIFTPFWGQRGVISTPSTIGGTNWPPSSYNRETGYLYVCSADAVSIFTSSEVEYDPAKVTQGEDFLGSAFNAPDGSFVRGTFTAMDMRTNKIAWQKQWNHSCYSGSVTTAGGLVFVGHNDGRLIAYDARNGGQLWAFQTGAGANSTATVFEQDGKQYVMFVAAGSALGGTTHGDNVWLFGLDGKLGPAATPGIAGGTYDK